MKWNNLIVILIVIIIVLICIEWTRLNTLSKCPKQVTEYRYVPRSFREEQEQPVSIDDIFGIMFSKPSPWMISRGIRETGRQINRELKNTDFKVNGKTFGERTIIH